MLDKRDECSNGNQQMKISLLDVEPWMRTLDDRLLLKFRIPSEAYLMLTPNHVCVTIAVVPNRCILGNAPLGGYEECGWLQ
jgi:hypothetical protein